ncbi:MAG: pilus assembly protein [Pseudomonadota bacterium]
MASLPTHRKTARGAALLLAMCALLIVGMLGLAALQAALQALKSARLERDRVLALQAAEAALDDAQADIEGGADPHSARAALFGDGSAHGFEPDCGAGGDSVNRGLCLPAGAGAAPLWQTLDLVEDQHHTVEYGRFSGAHMQTGQGTLPARAPRYIIELVPLPLAGEDAGAPAGNFYRITAIGFGANVRTRVVLQTYYRKEVQ